MEQVEHLKIKGNIIKMRLSHLENVMMEEKLSTNQILPYYRRLTELIDEFEKLYIECENCNISDKKNFNDLLDRYYAIDCKINTNESSKTNIMSESSTTNTMKESSTTNTMNESSTTNTMRESYTPNTMDELSTTNTTDAIDLRTNSNKNAQQKYPRYVNIQKFDGDFGKWLSFKNKFLSLVDSRPDLSNLDKFICLRNSLNETVLSEIEMYPLSETNYKKAWNELSKLYDYKRLLLTRAADELIDTPLLENVSKEGIMKFINNTRAHMYTINSFNSPHAIYVRLIERVLPTDIYQEWEKQLDLNTYPELEKLHNFLIETMNRRIASPGFSLSKETETETSAKRKQPNNTRTSSSQTQYNVYKSPPKCILCKQFNHKLYRCLQYDRMTKSDRWKTIKINKMCPNCLHKHQGLCRSPLRCKICNKLHHTSLHLTDYENGHSNQRTRTFSKNKSTVSTSSDMQS